MTDQDVRDFLERMATEEPVQFLDPEPLARRARRRAARTVVVGALGVAAAIGVVFAGAFQLREEPPRVPINPPEESSVDLGIFEPATGRIVYCTNSELWTVDPSAPSPVSTLAPLDPEGTTGADRPCASFTVPLGWSSDGTKLLYVREDATDRTFPYDRHLYVLHADGTETQVTPDPVDGAAISPDGSRVAFAADDVDDDGLYVVETEGGQPVRIAEGEEPTFSPDGTQIAFLSSPRSGGQVRGGREHVWVVNANGTDAREILADEPALAKGVFGLTWSPAGDRIAMENTLGRHVAIYTFAPDGSDFTEVIPDGANPHWSPDGSQISYELLYPGQQGLRIADADGSNPRSLGVGSSGPWHPGTLEDGAESPTPPSTSTSPRPSPSPGPSRFTSAIHGISIDPPPGWQTRPATEPWTGEALNFGSPAADVVFDPALGDGLYLVVASQPYGGLSQDEWRNEALDWLCIGEGMAAGSWTVDNADAFVLECGSTRQAALAFTDTRGYLIRLVVSGDDPKLARTYDFDWFKPVLESVDLRPDEALGAPSPSASQ